MRGEKDASPLSGASALSYSSTNFMSNKEKIVKSCSNVSEPHLHRQIDTSC